MALRSNFFWFFDVLFNPVAVSKFLHTVASGYVMGALLQIPAPAFCLLIAMLAIPPGAFLGKNLYSSFSGYTDYVGGRNAGYSHYMGGWGYGYNGNTSKQRAELVGTLIMNVYNSKDKKQIWQAIATGAVNENARNREQTIPETVSIIMRRFPVRPN